DPQAPVQPGDVLYLIDKKPGQPRRIVDIWDPAPGPAPLNSPKEYIVQLDQPLESPTAQPWPQYVSEEYVIFRQARPMAGEPILQLPKDVGIDFSRDPASNDPTKWTWHRFYPKLPTGGGTWM